MSRPQPMSARPQDLPVKADLARLRVIYVKSERLAYLGHLDLISTVERCVRRSGLPFSVGNGFARRMRVQFSQALPVGASSSCECFDVRLTERVSVGEALAALGAATPPALAPVAAGYVDGRLPALEAWLTRASWEVELLGARPSAEELGAAVDSIVAEGTLTYLRGEKSKTVDLGSALVRARASEDDAGRVRLSLDTRSGSGGALRPRALLDAAIERAGLVPPGGVRVRRTGQWHEDEDGRLVEPLAPSPDAVPAPLS